MLLSDLHIHSTFSDGKYTIGQIVDLYGSAGFDVIAITDHLVESQTFLGKIAMKLKYTLTRENFDFYLETIRQQQERAWKKYRMILIPGYELTKNYIRPDKSAHILALGVESFMAADAEPLALLREIKARDGVSIAAHPYFTDRLEPQTLALWLNRSELAAEVDAWEAGNGDYLFKKLYASNYPIIASSDFHDLPQMTSWKTVIHANRNQADILQAIRDQNLEITFYRSNQLNLQSLFAPAREKSVFIAAS